MLKRSLLCLLISLSAAPPTPTRSLAQENYDFREMEEILQDEMRQTNTPGAVLAIVSGDKVIYVKAFGVANVETGARMTQDMLFQIGSLTKTFTATALVTL